MINSGFQCLSITHHARTINIAATNQGKFLFRTHYSVDVMIQRLCQKGSNVSEAESGKCQWQFRGRLFGIAVIYENKISLEIQPLLFTFCLSIGKECHISEWQSLNYSTYYSSEHKAPFLYTVSEEDAFLYSLQNIHNNRQMATERHVNFAITKFAPTCWIYLVVFQ